MRTWQVADVMTASVVTVAPDMSYREIVDLIAQRRISAVPVVDDFDRVLGIVSESDLLHKVELIGEPHEWRLFEGRRRRDARIKADAGRARELMTAPAITVSPQAPISAAARLMDHEQVKRLPVTDDLGRVVGIVSRADLLKVHLRPDGDIQADVVEEVFGRILGVPAGAVDVTVTDGEVTLVGELDRQSSTEIAERLTRRVSGVVDVINELSFDVDDRPLIEAAAWHGQVRVVN